MLGKGTVQGMMVTLRHFVETYFHRDGETPKTRGLFTVEYPEERLPLPERYRSLPMLLFDPETGDHRCTACGMCARVCPAQCIWITRAQRDDGKPDRRPAEFVIDTSICMGCGFCAEFCPADAIKMDHDIERGVTDRSELVFNLERLLKPTTYYAEISPTDWAEEEAKRAAKKKLKPTQAASE